MPLDPGIVAAADRLLDAIDIFQRRLGKGEPMQSAEESGDYPVFDGEDDGAQPTMSLIDLYFDIDSRPIEPGEFAERYGEGRVPIARDTVFGLDVSTEFVGINHNSDPNGQPWIFETIVSVDAAVVYEEWSSYETTARRAHTAAIWRVFFGGALRWRFSMAVRRMRHRVRVWLSPSEPWGRS